MHRATPLALFLSVAVVAGGGIPAQAQTIVPLAPLSPFTSTGEIALTTQQAIAEEWSAAPTIDGTLSEAAWATGAPLSSFTNAATGAPAAGAIEYRVGYGDDGLYIGGSVSSAVAADFAAVEVVIGGPDATSVHGVASVALNPSRTYTTAWSDPLIGDSAAGRSAIAATTATATASGRTSIEISIPWSELGGGVPTEGDTWQLNIVHVPNPGAMPMASWIPLTSSRYMDRDGGTVDFTTNLVDQARWGTLMLGAPAAGAVGWAPIDPRLAFTGLEQKELSFDTPSGTPTYELAWKAADSAWETLAPPTATAASGRTTLEFTHPPVTVDGLHRVRVVATTGSTVRVAELTFDRTAYIAAGEAAQGFVAAPPSGSTTVASAPASPAVQAILDLIPEHNGMRFVGLPEQPELSPEAHYALAPDGQSMIATKTSTVYPNASYPETHTITAYDRAGNPVDYPYYEDSEGRRYFLSAALWQLQREKALTDTEKITSTDPLGAARILYRFAQTYQNYVPTTDQRWHNFPMDVSSGAPYNYWGGMWNSWSVNDFVSLDPLLEAYRAVQQTDAFDVLSVELGVDVESYVREEMLRPSFDYVLSYPPTYGNLTYPIWNGLVELGLILGEPDYIHRAVEWIEDFMANRFLTDGTWYEVTTSYHNQTYRGLLATIARLDGYTDPAGYISPRTGTRYDDLDLAASFPALSTGSQFVPTLVYPDKHTLPLQDTWAANTVASPLPGAPILYPSAGIARTTSGTGATQAQTYLQFVPKYGHNHLDPLTVSFFDEGQELLPDLGYTHSKYYYFSTSTIGHNTVVVDGADMRTSGAAVDGGQIERFVPDGGPISVMRAAQPSAYPQTDEYSREPWFIRFPGSDDGYMLDVFRVEGGERHEYTLNGYAGGSAEFSTDLTLTDYGDRLLPPGVEATEATGSGETGDAEGHYPGYIYVTDVKKAALPEDQYHVQVETYDDTGAEKAVLEITGLLEDGDNELFLGRAPSIKNTRELGRVGDVNDILEEQTMPKLVLRREGTALSSTFTTVLEAHASGSAATIEGADRLPVDSGPDGAVAVQVTYGGVTDILLSNSEDPQTEMTVGDVSMTGELGFIRIVDGDIVDMRLVNGTELSKGATAITGDGEAAGQVISTERVSAGDAANVIVTDAPVPADAVGRYLIVRHPDGTARGYEIADVAPRGTGSAVTLATQDPGFTIDGATSQLDFYPRTAWTGAHGYTVEDRVALASPVIDAPVTGSLTGTVTDQAAAPVAGATVSVSGFPSATAITDVLGAYTISGVPLGTRRVVASASGYVDVVSGPATVAVGPAATIDVSFKAESLPVLTDVPVGVGAGHPVAATSSKAADVYLVPAGTAKNATAITAAAIADGASVSGASPGVPVSIPTSSLDVGEYRIYAIDANGGISRSASVAVLATDMGVVEDTDPRLRLSSGWRAFADASHHDGSTKRASAAGESADLLFYGSAARVYAQVTPGSGIAEMFVDGQLAATVDTFANPLRYQDLVFDTGRLSEGVHEISVRVTGTARPAAWDTFIALDYIEVVQSAALAPALSAVSTGPLVTGEDVVATADEASDLYLVPAGTAADVASVATAATSSGATASATAAVPTAIDTTGLATGSYVVFAVDGDDNLSTPSSALFVVQPTSGTIQDDSTSLRYTGNWPSFSSTAYSGGTLRRGQSSGATVEIPFYGTSIDLVANRQAAAGMMNVYLDGVFAGTVDAYATPNQYQQVLFQQSGLALGAHVLTVEAAWMKNTAATNYYVYFDAAISAQ